MTSNRPYTTGIILMAGRGERFGDPLPKQFRLLCGKLVYQWTLHAFIASSLFDEILLVTHPEWVLEVEGMVKESARVIAGGHTRQASSLLGLLASSPQTEIVLIHDGVRPFVSKKLLEETIEAAREYGAADTCIPLVDTLVYAPNGSDIAQIPKRSHYFQGQTPQAFSYPLITKAHKESSETNATDDCQLVLNMGHLVKIVPGDIENRKITTPLDFSLAEQKLKKESSPS